MNHIGSSLRSCCLSLGLLAIAGCGDSMNNNSEAGAFDASADAAPDTSTDSSTDTAPADASSDAGGGNIRVRVAHLSPNAPAVDFCIKPRAASAFTTPTLRGLGANAGLAYSQVTAYLSIPAGEYTVRLVAPGAMNCDTALAMLPDVTLPMLPAGTVATVAAVGVLGGMGTDAFAVRPFIDDSMPVPSGQARVRFVHASAGTPAVDVGALNSGGMFTPLFSNVAFPNTLTTDNGYLTTAPLMGATLAARVNGTMPASANDYPLVLEGVNVPAGASVTVFAIGRLNNDQTPLSALACVDSAPATNNLTACTVLPARIAVRVAHLSPNAPAVDFCVKPMGSADAMFTGPVLRGAGVNGGLAFPNVTEYLRLPPGAWTVRLVDPASTNCSTSLAGLPNYDLPNLSAGARATVAAIGRVGDMGTTAFRLQPIVDGNVAPALDRIKVRFFHASPGTPPVDVGPLAGGMFTALFSNVSFGALATPMGAEEGTGYAAIPALSNATLTVRPTGTTMDALTLNSVSAPTTPSGTALSIFAIGELPGMNGVGTGARRLSALVCQDRVASQMRLAPCARLPAM